MTKALLTCLSHTPLKGYVDPLPAVVDEVGQVVAQLRAEVEAFDPELVFLFAPDHYNGLFYDLMPPFVIATAAESVADYQTLPGPLSIPRERALEMARFILDNDVDIRPEDFIVKPVRHSELLDWLKLLVAEDIPLEALQSKDDKVAVPPLVGALLKNEQDVTLFEKLVFMQRHNR